MRILSKTRVSRFQSLARVLVSAVLVVLLASSVEVKGLLGGVRLVSISALLIALSLAALDRILMAFKWNILLRAKSIRISLARATKAYLTASFLGLALPTTIGAEAVRTYSVSKDGHNPADVAASIVVERGLGLYALLIYCLFAALIGFRMLGDAVSNEFMPLLWAIPVMLITFVILIWGSSRTWTVHRVYPRFGVVTEKLAGRRFANRISESYDSYLQFGKNRFALVIFFLLSLVENIFPILWTYFMALAIGISVPLIIFFILVPIAMFFRRLPISLDGFGLHEGVFVLILPLFAVAKTDAFLLGISTHLLAIAVMLPGGYLYLSKGLGRKSSTVDILSPTKGSG